MKYKPLLWSVMLGLLAVACQGESVEVTRVVTEKETVVERETIVMGYSQVSSFDADIEAALPTQVPPSPPAERLIVRNASLELVVRDTQAALDAITALVDELDGYVVSSQLTQYDEGARVSLTVRVPAESLDAALARLRDLATEVRRQTVSGEDVTQEYTDLQARLRHLEATEARLLTFLDQAEDTEATLAVYRELQQVQGEIEGLKGRRQYLEQSSATSSISVELIPDALARPISVAGWRPQGTLRDALQALVHTLQFLVEALIWVLVYVTPVVVVVFVLPLGVLVWLGRCWRRRRGGNRK
jgi:hypothetical protein